MRCLPRELPHIKAGVGGKVVAWVVLRRLDV
jgi:hypothetical protein